MATDRKVAGIWCHEVLEYLSDYVDGALDAGVVERIENHLRGCDWCETFGREFSATIRALRAKLRRADALDDDVARRLMERLRRAESEPTP